VVLTISTLAAVLVVWTAWGRTSAGGAQVLLSMALLYWGLVIAYSLAVVPIVWPRIMLPGMLPFMLGLGLGVATHPRGLQRAAAGPAGGLVGRTLKVRWASRPACGPH